MKFRSISAVLSILTMIAFASCSALFDDDTGSITVAAPRGVSRDAGTEDYTTPNYYMVYVIKASSDKDMSEEEMSEVFSELSRAQEQSQDDYYDSEENENAKISEDDFLYNGLKVGLGEKKVLSNIPVGIYTVVVLGMHTSTWTGQNDETQSWSYATTYGYDIVFVSSGNSTTANIVLKSTMWSEVNYKKCYPEWHFFSIITMW